MVVFVELFEKRSMCADGTVDEHGVRMRDEEEHHPDVDLLSDDRHHFFLWRTALGSGRSRGPS